MPTAAVSYCERDLERLAAKERRENDGQKEATHPRPKTRGECLQMPRPCPYVGCRYHLFLNVSHRGSIQFPFGEDVDGLQHMPETCALDVADRGYSDRHALGALMNVTQQALVPLGHSALARIGLDAGLAAHVDAATPPVFSAAEHIRDRYGPNRYALRRRRYAAQAFAAATLHG